MSIDRLLDSNREYADGFDKGDLPKQPARKLAVVTCMDARVDVHRILGLEEGDAHVIRNAGGIVGEEEIRSLAISQRALGTEQIVLIKHTQCGMLGFSDDDFKRQLEEETGQRPEWEPKTLSDLEHDVRLGVTRLKQSPFLPHTDSVHGFVYEVETGRLREVQ